VKKLNVEGGVAAKARAVYAALFVPAAAEPESNGSSSPKSPGSPRANGSSEANGSSSSVKLMPAFTAAVPLLKELANDPPGQLAQLVAMEWLLTVRVCVDDAHCAAQSLQLAVFTKACVLLGSR